MMRQLSLVFDDIKFRVFLLEDFSCWFLLLLTEFIFLALNLIYFYLRFFRICLQIFLAQTLVVQRLD